MTRLQNDDAEKGWQEVKTRRTRRVRGKASLAHSSPACDKLADVSGFAEVDATAGNAVAELRLEACNTSASLAEHGPCNSFLQGDSDWFVVVERTFISVAPRHKLTHTSSAPGDLEGCLQKQEPGRRRPTGAHPWVPLTQHLSSLPLVQRSTAARPSKSEAASDKIDCQKAQLDEVQALLGDDAGRSAEEVAGPARELDDGGDSDDSMPPLEPAEISPQTAARSRVSLQQCVREEAARPQMVTIATQTEDLDTHEDAGADKRASSDVAEDDGSEHASHHDDEPINDNAGSQETADVADDQNTIENVEVNVGVAVDMDLPFAERSSAAVNKALRRARRRARLREAAQHAKQASVSKEAEEAATAAKKRARERIVVLLRRAQTELLERFFHPWRDHVLQATADAAETVYRSSDAKCSASSSSDSIDAESLITQAIPTAKCRQSESRSLKEIRIESGNPDICSGFFFHPSLPSMVQATQPRESKLPSPEKGTESEETQQDLKLRPDIKKQMLGKGHQIFSPVDFGMKPTSLFPSSLSPVLEEAIQGKVVHAAYSNQIETETPLSKVMQEQISNGHSSVGLSPSDGKHAEGQKDETDDAAQAAESCSKDAPVEFSVRPNLSKKAAVKFSPCSLPFVPQNVPKKAVSYAPCSLPFVPHMKAQRRVNQSLATHETKGNEPIASTLCGIAAPAGALAPKAEGMETSVDVQVAAASTVAQKKGCDLATSLPAAQDVKAIAAHRQQQSGQRHQMKLVPNDAEQTPSHAIRQPAVLSEEESSLDVGKPMVSVTQLDPMAQQAKSLLFAELQKIWAEESHTTGRGDGEIITESSAVVGSMGVSSSKSSHNRCKAKAKVVPSGVVGQCVQSPDASRGARSSGPPTSGAASHVSRSGGSTDEVGETVASVKAVSESFSDTVAARVAARGLALLKAEMRKVQSSGSIRDSHSPAKGKTAGAFAAATSEAAAAAGHRPGAASRLFTAAAARVRSGEVEVPKTMKRSHRLARVAESSAAHGGSRDKDA